MLPKLIGYAKPIDEATHMSLLTKDYKLLKKILLNPGQNQLQY